MPEQTVLDVLKAARALIADPERWTQRTDARNAHGLPVDPRDTDATCWCPIGACFRVSPVRASAAMRELSWGLPKSWDYGHRWPLANWNNASSRTHRAVLHRFDRAIARLEKEAADA